MNKLEINSSGGKTDVKLDDLKLQRVEYFEVKSSTDGTAELTIRLNVQLDKLILEDKPAFHNGTTCPVLQERIINIHELEDKIHLAKTNLSIIRKLLDENKLELMKNQLDILNERFNEIEKFEFHLEQRKVYKVHD